MPGGANGIGPNLYGVVGRAGRAASAGFAYSDAMTAPQGRGSDLGLDELDQFLTAPARYVPGTKMSFAGLRDTPTRVNLIAYLRSQGSPGFAVPAPDPDPPARRRSGSGAATAPAEGAAPVEGAPVGPEAAPATGAAGAVADAGPRPAAPPAATSPAPPNS